MSLDSGHVQTVPVAHGVVNYGDAKRTIKDQNTTTIKKNLDLDLDRELKQYLVLVKNQSTTSMEHNRGTQENRAKRKSSSDISNWCAVRIER